MKPSLKNRSLFINICWQKVSALIMLLWTMATIPAMAQKSCHDLAIDGLAATVKNKFTKQGMHVYREAMLEMSSLEPTPIALNLQQNTTYQLIFIGNSHANKLAIELFDESDKMLYHKTERGVDYILYTFTPPRTEVYLVTLLQKKGTGKVCGYFGIMTNSPVSNPTKEASEKKPVTTPKPATNKSTPPATKKPVSPTQPSATTPTHQAPPKATNTPSPKTNTRSMPDNQRPNPNRTKATEEYQKQQNK